MNIALRSSKFRGIFNFNQHHEVQIMPHVMLDFNVLLKTNSSIIKSTSIKSTNEARALQNQLLLLLLRSQVSESVNDDTKNEIQNDNNDDEEEEQVINHTTKVQWFLRRRCSQNITDSTAITKTLIHGCHNAHEE